MLKKAFIIVICIGIGFYAGTYKTEIETQKTIKEQQASFDQLLSELKEQKTQVEEEKTKIADECKVFADEIKLNENQPGFMTIRNLGAPEFLPSESSPLKSDKKGNILVRWQPVKGAKKYIVSVLDLEGNEIMAVDVSGAENLSLSRLPKNAKRGNAEFEVRVAAVNGLDQVGPQSSPLRIRYK